MGRRVAMSLIAAALPVAALAQAGDRPAPGDWPKYARDLSGDRYSPLTEINTSNVKNLKQAWSFRLRPDGGAAVLGGTVPIVIANVMYFPTGNAVVALEADSGRQLWRHPVKGLVRRGVSWWPGDGTMGPRIFYSTGSEITALDPKTGEVDATYGDNGVSKIDGTPYAHIFCVADPSRRKTVAQNALEAGNQYVRIQDAHAH